MKWLLDALATSVGKKFVMGITGLLLCGFLVVHLAGNFLMYVGPQAYNNYAHALHSQEWFVKIAEVILAILFLSHIVLAIRCTRENRIARNHSYEMKVSKIDNPGVNKLAGADSWMFISGAVVLAFLLLHLWDFTLEGRTDISYLDGNNVAKEPFEKAVMILQTPVSFVVYLVGCVLLGWHLSHGFASAFQSLGLSHPKYDPLVRVLSLTFALVVGLGFASFPLWAWLEGSVLRSGM